MHRALTTRLQKLFSNGAQAWEISRTVEALERLQYHRDRFGKQCKASIPRPIRWLEAVDLMIPRRLSQEDLGDALELVGMLHRRAAPAWKVWAVTLSRIVWILLSAAGEVIAAVRGNTGSKKETK